MDVKTWNPPRGANKWVLQQTLVAGDLYSCSDDPDVHLHRGNFKEGQRCPAVACQGTLTKGA